jgi:hypothetical protein
VHGHQEENWIFTQRRGFLFFLARATSLAGYIIAKVFDSLRIVANTIVKKSSQEIFNIFFLVLKKGAYVINY